MKNKRSISSQDRSQDRLALAQNFLVNPQTVRRLVQLAELRPDDFVLEIGPGEGIITRQLARTAGKVLAIEIDRPLFKRLEAAFSAVPHVEVRQGNVLQIQLPREPYKIYSNIPFNITAPIMHKLWEENQPPRVSYLIMQREAAEKFTAVEPATESAILFQPWFEFDILAPISRFEFRPVPSVDAVLLRMRPLPRPLLGAGEKRLYDKFVSYGFRRWKKNLKIGYKDIFTYAQWKRLARDLGFPLDALPRQLTVDQWLGLYRYFKIGVTADKKRPVETFGTKKERT